MPGMPKKWIQKMKMKKGALHKDTGVAQGKKIPMKKIEKAEHSDNPKLAKRATLARTLRGLRK